ncbi:MAG: aldo/keto reductase [Oscillospiraceae bacterium]|nr:aldo/keto reductase [Oscillospiraceae bacterium]
MERNAHINKLGFGFLRLPETDGEPDWRAVDEMTDAYLAGGGQWFDTCYTYLNGRSEQAIRRCVTERYARESFRLVEKLPGYLCRTYEDCRRYFREEQRRCGTDFFDIFMLHWLNRENYEIAERVDEFRFLREVKQGGCAGRIGFSWHDSASLLDDVLSRHPEVDVVLMQINYLDWESAGIESRKCYETAVKHGKSVFVMEPVKGGTLAKLPPEAERILRALAPERTPSDWALRFVQSLPGVEVCLSGMNRVEQVRENLAPFPPLTEAETEALRQVAEVLRKGGGVPCTGCRYCVSHCPQHIAIPDIFAMFNELQRWPEEDWKIRPVYEQTVKSGARASDCIACRSCEGHCPQHIPISEWMRRAARTLES